MSLKDKIKAGLTEAQRARDRARVDSLRMLQAAIQRREVDERITLDDAQVLAVIERLVKQSKDAVEQFRKGGREDLAEKENRDIAVWQAYLPRPLTEAEVDRFIDDAIAAAGATSLKDMGKVMGALKPKVQGRADMGAVGAKVRTRLGAK